MSVHLQDVVGDIIGAHRAGLQGILVKTGEYISHVCYNIVMH